VYAQVSDRTPRPSRVFRITFALVQAILVFGAFVRDVLGESTVVYRPSLLALFGDAIVTGIYLLPLLAVAVGVALGMSRRSQQED